MAELVADIPEATASARAELCLNAPSNWLFHWALVICVIGRAITGTIGGDAMTWHFRLGHSVFALELLNLPPSLFVCAASAIWWAPCCTVAGGRLRSLRRC